MVCQWLRSFKSLLIISLMLCAPEGASADALKLDCVYHGDNWDKKHSSWYHITVDQQASMVDQSGSNGRLSRHAQISAEAIIWDDDEGGHWIISRPDLRLFFTSLVYKITWAYQCGLSATPETRTP